MSGQLLTTIIRPGCRHEAAFPSFLNETEGSIMGWKWDASKAHTVKVTVAPAGDQATVGIVWGDQPEQSQTLTTAQTEKLLHNLAQHATALGYMM